MKRTKTKILSVFLSFCMIISCMVGMSVTASAGGAVYTFNATADNWVPSGDWEYTFALTPAQLSKITKIEVLIYMESIAETGWGTVTYCKGTSGAADRVEHTANLENTPSIKKYTAGEGVIENADWAGVQLVGKGKLLAYMITFSEGDPVSAGDWRYPEITFPTGLTATVGQTLADVALPTATNGTWSWSNSSTSVGEAGEKTFPAKFTPSDASLNTIFGINVPVTVNAASTTPSWTNGSVIAILDGTKLTVAKKADAQDGAMGTGWTAVGSADVWNDIKGTITEVEIQPGVTSIGNNAFDTCPALESITIPDSVTSIGEGAFLWCTALTSVSIPDSVTSIGNSAFAGCTVLTSVTIPNGVTSISDSAFQTCTALTSVSIPDSVTRIGEAAFNSCTSLTSVTIPSKVARIGDYAFRSCTSLTRVTIPGSVTRIGDRAFIWCGNLATVTFEPRSTEDIESNATLTICEDAFFDTVEGAKVVYGTGDTVLYDGENEITTDTLLADIQGKNLTWKESTGYKITMSNGGKAYVTNEEVTSAEAGTVVTIKADTAVSGTRFNGWTTTTEGVKFADEDSAETTFKMPESDVEITASFENILYHITVINGTADKETAEAGQTVTVTADKLLGAVFTGWTSDDVVFKDASAPTTTFVMPIKNVTVKANYDAPYIKPVPAPSGGSTTPSHSSSSSDVSGTSASGQKLRAVLNADNSLTVDWDKISGASKYILYYEKDGKDVKVIETKNNKITMKTAKNGFTYKFRLKYITSGQTLDAPTGYTATLKVYYKPIVKLTQKDGKVTAKWAKVPGAEYYKVYRVVNGKLKYVTKTTKTSVRFKATKGKTVTYTVSAVVGGKETELTKSDRKSIKVK